MPGRFCCGKGEDGPAVGGKSYLWCVTGDWCAYVCVGFVYLSLVAIDVTTTLFCIVPMYGLNTPKGTVHLVFFQSVVFMVLFSHLSASWSDPGLVSKDTSGLYIQIFEKQLAKAIQAEKNGDIVAVKKLRKSFCRKCQSPKPQGAHHCSLCGRCVRRMDHHCPWVNNCVGERNLKAFVLFLFYVAIGTGYAIIMNTIRAHQIVTSTRPEDRYSKNSKNMQIAIVVGCILSFIVAIFFFAFVLCMFYDQYEALTTGVPGVDAMQISGDIPRIQSCWTGYKRMVVVNEPFGWRWFVPIAPKLPRPPPPLAPPETSETAEGTEHIQEEDIPVPESQQPTDSNISTLLQRFPPPKAFGEKHLAQMQGEQGVNADGNSDRLKTE